MDKISYGEFLELPTVQINKESVKQKVIKKPDVSMLNDLQKEIFDIITNLPVGKFSQTLLTGYSGTGKGFLVTKIIEEIIFKDDDIKIAITAPTNKAVHVLKKLSSICDTHLQVDFNTLHSLLGLKRVITDEGKEEYKAEFGKGSSIDDYNVIIVDEVSMLNNILYEDLLKAAKKGKKMLLFVGDRGQIPPVNGGESILFKTELKNNFNLKEIIRQASGNPIINIAEKVRNNQKYKSVTDVDENGNGVIFLKIRTETQLLDTYFNSENFKINANFVKVLAYTNKAVDYYNHQIRQLIYGENCPKLNIGEKMICNKPITDSRNKIILNNNDEFIVNSFTIKVDKSALKLSYYEVDIESNGKSHVIKILAEVSIPAFNKELKSLKDAAAKTELSYRRYAWLKYFNFLDKYADVKYNYALTVHKSQGSTFDNAIVINCDIERMSNTIEKNKLLYTAMTRAKNKLFII